MGFPNGGRYKGTPEQKERLETTFLRKCAWMHEHKVPIWNGEFGPVYEPEHGGSEAAEINKERFEVLGEQLRVYEKYKVGWSIWLYKDIGVQGNLLYQHFDL